MSTTPTGMPSMRWIRMKWALRRLGLHRNAMRRPIDRTQSVIALALFLVFLAFGPVAAAGAARHAYDAGVRTERHHSATRQHVEATVVRRNAATTSGQTVGGRDLVTWRMADGSPRSGVINTGKAEGAHLGLWVDDSGGIKGAPQTRTQTVGTACFAGAGGLVAVALPLALCYALVRRRAGRRRLAEWDEEWAMISPHWTGRS